MMKKVLMIGTSCLTIGASIAWLRGQSGDIVEVLSWSVLVLHFACILIVASTK